MIYFSCDIGTFSKRTTTVIFFNKSQLSFLFLFCLPSILRIDFLRDTYETHVFFLFSFHFFFICQSILIVVLLVFLFNRWAKKKSKILLFFLCSGSVWLIWYISVCIFVFFLFDTFVSFSLFVCCFFVVYLLLICFQF